MISLYKNGINGILADQMGLGKTIQTIGFFSYLRKKGVMGPFMVVGPLSTLHNWRNEVEKWCPSLPCLIYHGDKTERAELRRRRLQIGQKKQTLTEDYPLIITSYEVLIQDRPFLEKMKYKYIIVDEGHRLKNFNCKLIRELYKLETDNKLLLSGT